MSAPTIGSQPLQHDGRPATRWLVAVVRTARPKQWVKNLLVFAAPGAAGVLTHGRDVAHAGEAFAVMCLVASGIYFLNDAADAEADRANPRTRNRPVASGVLRPLHAVAIGIALIAIGAGASPLVSLKLAIVVGVYVASSVAYVLWLRSEPVVDMAVVASGFVLRAIAGAVAVGVPISEWFLIVATFGSLFMVSGKRLADVRTAPASIGSTDDPPATRPSRPRYSMAFLQSVLVMSLSVTIAAYCLWAFENVKASGGAHAGHAALCFQLSIVPFSLAMLRYGFLVDQGEGGSPEELAFGDGMLAALAVVWLVIFAVGVYL